MTEWTTLSWERSEAGPLELFVVRNVMVRAENGYSQW